MGTSSVDVLEVLRADRVAAVVRGNQVGDPAGLSRVLAESGIRCVEFTFTIPSVTDVIAAAARDGAAVVGAGTVTTAEQARAAIEAGARFVVSPGLAPEIMPVCREHGVPVLLGAFTPTEVATAVSLGAAAVKIFPARLGGPDHLRDLRGPFPQLQMVPSGGVTAANAGTFLAAGACAVFAGSELVPPGAVERGEHDVIAERARAYRAAITS
jgi:2-dehydro-3-deoxyphosphogluconate aldolase/(4S)-4-hydroxy-2-oxoglutarate aldolase